MNSLDKVKDFLKKYNMIATDSVVIAGVSGGADSMCLLFLLCELGIDVRVIHVNHGIRGKEADEDAAYVESFCKKANIPCKIFCLDIPSIAKKNRETLEEAGRRERYRIFREEAALIKDKTVSIAVASHMNDQAETVIHNMLRGSGLHGLCGMQPVDRDIIRPLLCITREEIEAILLENGIKWREDSTNTDIAYTRNRIRHEILPQAKLINGRAIEHIVSSAEYLSEIEDFLRSISASAFDKYVSQEEEQVYFLDASILKEQHRVIVTEVVRVLIEKTAGRLKDITSEHIDMIIALFDKQCGREISLPYNILVSREYEGLRFRVADDHTKAQDETKTEIIPYEVSTRIIDVDDAFDINAYPKEAYTKWFDYDKIPKDAVWRYREASDRIKINGGSKKLQDYFTNNKISREMRDEIPVFAYGNDIIWIVGYRISEAYKVLGETKRILEVSLRRK